jgi:hypothetical protein
MASRPAHDLLGIASGAAGAALGAGDQPGAHLALEVAGGALAGWFGSRLPDIIDPPTTPDHRSVAHGALSAGVVGWSIGDVMTNAQQYLRDRADDLVRARETIETDLQRAINLMLECICRLLAGAVAGLPIGYASHLALDLMTPRGLPLLVKGF